MLSTHDRSRADRTSELISFFRNHFESTVCLIDEQLEILDKLILLLITEGPIHWVASSFS